MKTVKINILDKHIKGADRGEPTSCMVAQAIKDQLQLGPSDYVSVEYKMITVKRGDSGEMEVTDVLPRHAAKIRRWDDDADVRPFSIDVNIPD